MADNKKSWVRTVLIRMLRSLALTVVLGWLLFTIGLWLAQEQLIFQPTRGEPHDNPSQWRMPFARHLLQTSDGENLDVWWMPRAGSDRYLLFCHGNAGNLGHRLDTFRALHLAGFNVLAFDYRGYGISSGSPSEQGLYLDADRVWQFAVQDLGIPGERLIIHGRSLGGGVAAYLAQKFPARALILESTFTSLPDVAADHYPYLPVRSLARHFFPTAERLADITAPILIIHGKSDTTTPFHHGLTLYAIAQEPKTMVVLEGDHNTGYSAQAEAWMQGIVTFVDKLP